MTDVTRSKNCAAVTPYGTALPASSIQLVAAGTPSVTVGAKTRLVVVDVSLGDVEVILPGRRGVLGGQLVTVVTIGANVGDAIVRPQPGDTINRGVATPPLEAGNAVRRNANESVTVVNEQELSTWVVVDF